MSEIDKEDTSSIISAAPWTDQYNTYFIHILQMIHILQNCRTCLRCYTTMIICGCTAVISSALTACMILNKWLLTNGPQDLIISVTILIKWYASNIIIFLNSSSIPAGESVVFSKPLAGDLSCMYYDSNELRLKGHSGRLWDTHNDLFNCCYTFSEFCKQEACCKYLQWKSTQALTCSSRFRYTCTHPAACSVSQYHK